MKTKEELNALKTELEALGKKLADLSEEELNEVIGGSHPHVAADSKNINPDELWFEGNDVDNIPF